MDLLTNDLELGKQLMSIHYPHLPFSQIEVIQGGGIKTIWKVATSSGTMCLKRIRKSIPIVKFTTSAQAFLASKGALVADIIPTKENELFFVHEGHALVLYQWIEGSDLEMEENHEHLVTGLKGLAQFHKDSVGFVPPENSETYDRMGVWPAHFNKMYEEFKQWKSYAEQQNTPFHQTFLTIIDKIIWMAEQSIDLLNKSCYSNWVQSIGKYGFMCHQDYGQGNALETSNGVYVLDLDNLAYDIPIRDVRKLITKRMEEIGSWDITEVESLIDHYSAVNPLNEEQRKIIYIDMLFPHKFYGYAKKPFNKGELGEEKKLMKTYHIEARKMEVLKQALKLS